ncbi:D-arabinitol 4-dehydrogenase [Aquincola sp. MAHUQ-54]|uniref:D-arabinitol 4-dehydrogenase n=1 Tax=Aquincola agrisoli TaxID=3119538 RepID=A0AAW9Q3E3_9BURK
MNVILHLGLGSFHRAHQAVYLDDLIEKGDTSWHIVGANLRDDMAATMAALAAQGGEYTLETVTPAGERTYRRIRSIRQVLPFDASLANVIEVGAQPSTRIISFTVTEGGYYLDEHHRLDTGFADVASDLAGTTRQTIYGALAAVLAERMRRDAGPVTLQNCDNLRSNGERFRSGLLDFLERRGDGVLRAWVEANTTCPNAMVDRITPRPLPEVAARVQAATGWADQAPVMAERFIQWVIEDHFANGRPDWEAVGVEMVPSVLPYEEAKIRVLNASHSCIAWAGSLIGLTHIHEAVAVPAIRRMAYDYVTDDVIPALDPPGAPCPLDLAAYRDVVLDRFGNPYLADTLQRVAADGFSKIPGFILPTLRDRLAAGQPIDATAMLPALFFAFLGRWHRGALHYAYQDGVMAPATAHGFFASPDPLSAFCADPLLWGPLAGHPQLVAAVRAATARVDAFVAAHAVRTVAP